MGNLFKPAFLSNFAEIMNPEAIILFDGVCNLCNKSVQFIIKWDKKNYFSFASLQSKKGQELLNEYHLPVSEFNSFILIENRKAYTRSEGALRVTKKLSGLWPLLYGLIIFPKFISDRIYNLIAKNRYKWFGRQEECMTSTNELDARFLN